MEYLSEYLSKSNNVQDDTHLKVMVVEEINAQGCRER